MNTCSFQNTQTLWGADHITRKAYAGKSLFSHAHQMLHNVPLGQSNNNKKRPKHRKQWRSRFPHSSPAQGSVCSIYWAVDHPQSRQSISFNIFCPDSSPAVTIHAVYFQRDTGINQPSRLIQDRRAKAQWKINSTANSGIFAQAFSPRCVSFLNFLPEWINPKTTAEYFCVVNKYS